MAGISYTGVELRKLPPRFRIKLAQLLDVDEAWKKLMCSIPSELEPELPKYTSEHMVLVERHGQKTGKACGEILLDEWSTSGRNRPRVETLLDILIQCQLFRAADYVATEILDISTPLRPESGPAAYIAADLSSHLVAEEQKVTTIRQEIENDEDGYRELFEKLNNLDYERGNLVNFNIAVIELATRNFSQEFCIGNGAFGSVYKLDLRGQGGTVLAIKLLHPTASCAEEQFLTEIRVLSQFRHENLVPLIGFCTNGPQYCLIYEYLQRGSLLEALSCENNTAPLEWERRVTILCGVAKGLHFLHTAKDKPLIHRDVKSANVLLDEKLIPKIGDFGLAKSFSSSAQTSALTSTIFGTSAYMAPEAFRGDISPKMDVFSFGVVILEVLTGLSPFDENRDGNDILTYIDEAVEDDDITPLLDSKAGRIELEEAMLIYKVAQNCREDKRRRPGSEQILKELQSIGGRFGGTGK